jgi:hypothetical protein
MTCRICYSSEGSLISVCGCLGTSAFVHKKCIQKWIRISQRSECEICLAPYTIDVMPVRPLDIIITLCGAIISAWHSIKLYQHIHIAPHDATGIALITISFQMFQVFLFRMLHRNKTYEICTIVLWFCVFASMSAVGFQTKLDINGGVLCSWIVSGCIYVGMAMDSIQQRPHNLG